MSLGLSRAWAGQGIWPGQGRMARGTVPVAGGRRSGRIGARRRRPVGWLADFVIAALRVHHDPPGFPAVPFLVASPVGQRVADDPGEEERQGWPGQHQHPEYPGDHVEIQVQVVGDLVIGCRGPQQPVEREAGHAGRGAVRQVGWRGRQHVPGGSAAGRAAAARR